MAVVQELGIVDTLHSTYYASMVFNSFTILYLIYKSNNDMLVDVNFRF